MEQQKKQKEIPVKKAKNIKHKSIHKPTHPTHIQSTRIFINRKTGKWTFTKEDTNFK